MVQQGSCMGSCGSSEGWSLRQGVRRCTCHVFDWPPLLADFGPQVQDGILVSPEELTL